MKMLTSFEVSGQALFWPCRVFSNAIRRQGEPRNGSCPSSDKFWVMKNLRLQITLSLINCSLFTGVCSSLKVLSGINLILVPVMPFSKSLQENIFLELSYSSVVQSRNRRAICFGNLPHMLQKSTTLSPGFPSWHLYPVRCFFITWQWKDGTLHPTV